METFKNIFIFLFENENLFFGILFFTLCILLYTTFMWGYGCGQINQIDEQVKSLNKILKIKQVTDVI